MALACIRSGFGTSRSWPIDGAVIEGASSKAPARAGLDELT
jgi:hypothetical protein